MTARTRKSTQPKADAEAQVPAEETEVKVEAAEEAVEAAEEAEVAEPTVEELKAQLEALKAQLAAKPVRTQREVKPTPKQFRFLRELIADPTKSVPELCTAAGATETSHGFVFRMLEHGYIRLVLGDGVMEKYSLGAEAPAEEEGATSDSESEDEETASETA